MITSRLSRTSGTTIPRPVRAALGLQQGDRLAYIIEGDRALESSFRGSGAPVRCFCGVGKHGRPASLCRPLADEVGPRPPANTGPIAGPVAIPLHSTDAQTLP